MNFNLKLLFAPLIAIAVLAVIGMQTADALKRSGAWRRGPRREGTSVDPYARLDAQLAAHRPPVSAANLRDPFSYARAPVAVQHVRTRPVVPAALPRPVLTAILQGDNDPTALVHYNDRDYTIKRGSLFADFRVLSITADQVVLDRGGQRLVLQRPTKKGE